MTAISLNVCIAKLRLLEAMGAEPCKSLDGDSGKTCADYDDESFQLERCISCSALEVLRRVSFSVDNLLNDRRC